MVYELPMSPELIIGFTAGITLLIAELEHRYNKYHKDMDRAGKDIGEMDPYFGLWHR